MLVPRHGQRIQLHGFRVQSRVHDRVQISLKRKRFTKNLVCLTHFPRSSTPTTPGPSGWTDNQTHLSPNLFPNLRTNAGEDREWFVRVNAERQHEPKLETTGNQTTKFRGVAKCCPGIDCSLCVR